MAMCLQWHMPLSNPTNFKRMTWPLGRLFWFTNDITSNGLQPTSDGLQPTLRMCLYSHLDWSIGFHVHSFAWGQAAERAAREGRTRPSITAEERQRFAKAVVAAAQTQARGGGLDGGCISCLKAKPT